MKRVQIFLSSLLCIQNWSLYTPILHLVTDIFNEYLIYDIITEVLQEKNKKAKEKQQVLFSAYFKLLP